MSRHTTRCPCCKLRLAEEGETLCPVCLSHRATEREQTPGQKTLELA